MDLKKEIRLSDLFRRRPKDPAEPEVAAPPEAKPKKERSSFLTLRRRKGGRAGTVAVSRRPVLAEFELPLQPGDRDPEPDDRRQQLRDEPIRQEGVPRLGPRRFIGADGCREEGAEFGVGRHFNRQRRGSRHRRRGRRGGLGRCRLRRAPAIEGARHTPSGGPTA